MSFKPLIPLVMGTFVLGLPVEAETIHASVESRQQTGRVFAQGFSCLPSSD